MEEKKITLTFDLEQVANDILTKCNLISTSIRDEALADIRANVMEPDNPELRSIINRSVTEAFGEVKKACQRYMKVGRTEDNNLLERMVKSVTYTKKDVEVQDMDENNHLLYTCTVGGLPAVVYTEDDGTTWKDETSGNTVVPDATPEPKMVTKTVTTDEIDTIEYEEVELELYIPNFNVSVTDALKSHIHKFVVDYTMGRFLQDQVADKAAEYAAMAEGSDNSDMNKIRHDLTARERFNMRKPSWI